MSRKFFHIVFCLIIIVGFSACTKNYDLFHSKSGWIEDYFEEIKSGNYPDIYAVSWWNEDFDNTYLRINSSEKTLDTYRDMVNDELFISTCSFSNQKLVPVTGKIYHSAFPYFGWTEDTVTERAIHDFEELCQKEIAWAYFSNNWLDSLIFPASSVEIIKNDGKTPFIRLMFRSEFEESQPDPKYSLIDIVNGRYDAAIVAWADEAKSCGTNLLTEFGTEMNGSWFPWNGIYCGGGTTNGYGDPDYPDGPEIFRDAYIHIIDLCDQQGADNITWFFHFDVNDDPEEWWNNPVYYYPGDEYIDWLGVSTYGSFERGDEYVEPKDMLDKAYSRFHKISENKPYAVLEFGITEL